MHANGASFFFILIYLHIGRGIYYSGFQLLHTWRVGVSILLLSMATAFLGYVLPWGQISFWGATVITNLISSIPYVGPSVVEWLWGGFAIGGATLTRFFALHFICPFIIRALVLVHLIFLHQTGSSNPLGVQRGESKIPFHPYFVLKDRTRLLGLAGGLLGLRLYAPYLLGDPENFTPANSLVTPPHIQPEWYYLFAYAILRSIPNKLGGVIALLSSILALYFLPLLRGQSIQSLQFSRGGQFFFWRFTMVVALLTWIGARPVEVPYILAGQVATTLYFRYFLFFIPSQRWLEEQG